MDANKAEIKNIGNKLTDEHEGAGNKDMSKELENLNIIVDDKKLPVITIKEKDIELMLRKSLMRLSITLNLNNRVS